MYIFWAPIELNGLGMLSSLFVKSWITGFLQDKLIQVIDALPLTGPNHRHSSREKQILFLVSGFSLKNHVGNNITKSQCLRQYESRLFWSGLIWSLSNSPKPVVHPSVRSFIHPSVRLSLCPAKSPQGPKEPERAKFLVYNKKLLLSLQCLAEKVKDSKVEKFPLSNQNSTSFDVQISFAGHY